MSERHPITGARSGEQLKKIDVDYFARTEGEAGMHAVVSDHKLESFVFDLWEPPRFFEAFLVGRMYYEIPELVSRICGICPVSHHETATAAIEKAIGLEVDENTFLMRRLIALSQIVASHIIHLYMLSLPDYLGYDGMIEMMPDFPDEVHRFMRLKTASNAVTDAVGGRPLHTMSAIVGGFTRTTPKKRLREIREDLKAIKEDAVEVVRLFGGLNVPDYETDAVFVSLLGKDRYPVNGGMIGSSTGLEIPVEEYRKHFREWQVPTSHSKYTGLDGQNPIRVGAISRINLNFDLLSDDAKAIAKEVNYEVPNRNPFHNNLAQAIEVVSGIDGCIELIDEVDPESVGLKAHEVQQGEGGAITEAPRGSLYHWYKVDKEGVVRGADIVTPTAHQVFNLDTELRGFINRNIADEAPDLTMKCEKLVRAYDPCFSCSVHVVEK
ncbi:MAG: Ni/Fe hydrogenase subunit alpha [Candidatus Aquicultorales bacterium]